MTRKHSNTSSSSNSSSDSYHHKHLAVTMTNNLAHNKIHVYDLGTHSFIESISTDGRGGVEGNAYGVKQHDNKIVAVVNNGSTNVTIFKRRGNKLYHYKKVHTTSPPVSIDFKNQHMYVACATSVDSFSLEHDFERDGTALLKLAEGGIVPVGATCQVGALDHHLLVTLKSDPNPGTVDIIHLHGNGAIANKVIGVAGPANTLSPSGFTILNDHTALITLANTNNYGLFRRGSFVEVTNASQLTPCWATRFGKYVYTSNTDSMNISRLVTTGLNIFIDSNIAAIIPLGNPIDMDQNDGRLVVLDTSATTSHLNFFTINEFGELTARGTPIDVGVTTANGVAIML